MPAPQGCQSAQTLYIILYYITLYYIILHYIILYYIIYFTLPWYIATCTVYMRVTYICASVGLILDLQRVGLYGCGTLRSNQVGFPANLKPYTKKGLTTRGDSKTLPNGNVTVTLWEDTRPFIMIASNADPTVMEAVQRKRTDGARMSVSCPASFILYNKYMGGVDHSDQLRGYYTSNLKFRKYYKYIFWFLVNVAITNSFILSKEHSSLNIKNTKMFRITLAKELIGGYCSRKRAGRLSLLPIKKFCKDHLPIRGNLQGHHCCYCYTTRRVSHNHLVLRGLPGVSMPLWQG